MFSFFKKKSDDPPPSSVVTVLHTDDKNLSKDIQQWLPSGFKPVFLMAYVSPHVDFNTVCVLLKNHVQLYAPQCQIIATTTAGELCNLPGKFASLYCRTGNEWHSIVLQAFDQRLIKQIQIASIPLNNDDLKRGEINISHHDRVQRIAQSLSRLSLSFSIDPHDTVALTLLDGLSASESFFSEAVYSSRHFPCHFIGGSAGGKPDFSGTYIYDGQQVRQGHAVIAFLKIAPPYRYAIFTSHNFEKQPISFLVTEASQEQRWIKSVLTDNNQIISFIDALKRQFNIHSNQDLENKMADYSFAIEIDEKLYILSIAKFDFASDSVSFFRDIAVGEQLFLVKRKDLVECTTQDFQQFMANKQHVKPVGAILSDCLLRRQHNGGNLAQIHCFDAIPIGGFSTFGELYGINVNQTLTGLFFFQLKNKTDLFEDESVDLFPILYAQFQNYGLQRRLKQVDILSKIRKEVILKQEHYRTRMPDLNTHLTEIEHSLGKIAQLMSTLERRVPANETPLRDDPHYLALNAAIASARADAERVQLDITLLEKCTKMLDHIQ